MSRERPRPAGAIRAVTFDFWQTLMGEEPGHLSALRRAAWTRILREAGHDVPDDVLRGAFDDEWLEYEANWIAGRQYRAADAAHHLMDRIGDAFSPDTRLALTEAFVETGREASLEPAPWIADTLRTLREGGVRIGIVCDVGMTGSPILLWHLERNGLLGFFDHWSFSDVVGVYKPAREIFEHALEGLGGVAAANAAHVGDRLRTDVAGARSMGMVSVRYTGMHDDTAEGFAEADHVLASHGDLPAALGMP